jgi:hypothetical protein
MGAREGRDTAQPLRRESARRDGNGKERHVSDWSEGYVTEVDYTYGFYKEMAPAAIRFALLAAGQEAPPLHKFKYCELGFGQGAGLALLAAANPQGQFWGTDFNPAHAAGAEHLAEAADLRNLHVFDDSFEEFAQRDLPQFDYIVLHGVYSWISPESCKHIVDFIDKNLKVGGAVYISYNTLPGWTHAMPMRGLLSHYVQYQTAPADSINTKVDGALKLLADLNEIPGSYFKQTPQLNDRIKQLQGQSRKYLAHEYLNRNWRPLYFTQVVEDLEAAKLTWAASANPLHCVDALNHTKELQAVLDKISNPIFREAVRDLGINQMFRKDIFVRGPRKLSRHDQVAGLLDAEYVLSVGRELCALKIKTTVGEANLQAATYEPLLDHLAANGPTTGRQLMQTPAFRDDGGNVGRLLQALVVLVGANYVQPCVDPSLRTAAAESAKRFNATITRGTVRGSDLDLNFLASGLIGSGIFQPRLNQLLMHSLVAQPGADPQAHARGIYNTLRSLGQSLIKDGKPLDKEADSMQEIIEKIAEWRRVHEPAAKHLGLMA